VNDVPLKEHSFEISITADDTENDPEFTTNDYSFILGPAQTCYLFEIQTNGGESSMLYSTATLNIISRNEIFSSFSGQIQLVESEPTELQISF
jgi:hypothetical protein